MTEEEVRRYLGQHVTLHLTQTAPEGPTITGHLTGAIEAADGLVVHLEPEGSPQGTRVSYHYHYIAAISPA